jgi:hypothetical protein
MRHISERAEFLLEAVELSCPRVEQRLQGDDFASLPVVGFIDDTHASSPQSAPEFETCCDGDVAVTFSHGAEAE